MKRYQINLTIIEEDATEELAAINAAHLTGLDLKTITDAILQSILVEPEPEVQTVHKSTDQDQKQRHFFNRKTPHSQVPKPPGFKLEEINEA